MRQIWEATLVGTVASPEVVATRGHCCPTHGPGVGRDSRGVQNL